MKRFKRLIQFSILSFITLTSFNNCAKPSHTESSSSSLSVQQAGFKCTDRTATSKTKNYLLSRAQYLNTIEDIFGTGALTAASAQISVIGLDINDPDSYNRLSSISSSQAIAYYDAAVTIANYITSNTTRVATVFGACANNATPGATCIDTYLTTYAPKILRRPLTASEIAFIKQIMSTSGSYKENLKAVLTYHLSAPSFLWPLELGTNSSSGTRLVLTPYEVATRLSYMITDSTPDSALITSASDGSILTPMGLQTQVQRLLQSVRGRYKVKNNFLRWSLNDYAEDPSALPPAMLGSVQTSGLQAAMLSEADAFVDYVLYKNKGSLKDLVTSRLSFATHPGLAAIYGHSPVSNISNPTTITERRQGLLLRAPAMTDISSVSSIIRRGVHFLRRVICNQIPSPNVAIVNNRNMHVLTDTELLTVTNRAAITYQTEDTLCMSCHSTINPVGFVFEGFDTLGRVRSQEQKYDTTGALVNSLPIHTNSSVPLPGNRSIDAVDAYDMVSQLLDSNDLASCLTKNSYRYFYERQESRLDDCQLQDSFDVVRDSNQPALSAIEKLLTSDKIYYKEL